MVTLLFFSFLGALVHLQWLPLEMLLLYIGGSCIAFCIYGFDKFAARNGKWRTRESTLHILGFLGGWPGALLAQRIFRHKTSKSSFQKNFWITVIGNCAVLGCFLYAAI